MLPLPRPDWAGRLQALRAYVTRETLDALVVSHPANLTYLTGFAGSTGLLVCTPQDTWLITDGRYDTAVRQGMAAGTMASVRVERVDSRYDLTLAHLVGRLGVARLAFEADHVTVGTLRRWRALASDVDWRPTDEVVERQRLIKDAVEVAVFRQAGRALAGVARRLRSWVIRGRRERDVAAAINRALERAGFSGPAFPTIVASGPNSALPHARPTDRRLADGDLVVLDFGGVLGGYCVDLTRVAAIGQVDSSAESLYVAVRDAQAAALAAVRAGVPGSDVDRAARGVLESRGLGAAFLHGTGHGLGLDVHEAPRIARADSGARDVLEAGMVCTIEPGAYVEGLGGIRLEDDVLVTTEGCEVLTDAPRDLLVV
jgi:Xaa-Pro aminopeptidase